MKAVSLKKPGGALSLKGAKLARPTKQSLSLRLPEKIKDPLADVKYSGDEEKDVKAEQSALLKAFNERAKREQQRYERATDTEFWVAVCFCTRAQKEEFLRLLDLSSLGDKYLNGEDVAKRLGISLTER